MVGCKNGGFMKIRSKAYGFLFKKSISYLFAGIWCCMVPNLVFADAAFLMNQFRTPYSLSEMLHEGLIFVQDSLEQIVSNCKQNSIQLLQMMSSKLQELEALYTQMYAKSVHNEFRRDEREFLQELIDRIDHMIQQLENDESSPEEQELIKKNLDLLQSLKNQLGS
jgi:hypothetical protein